jgi:CheY-like chemotaxis protein
VAKSILVVDDDDLLREAISFSLAHAGYGVLEARNGKEALALLEGGFRPGLILLDLQMPVMDGEAFCRYCKASEQLRDIPVVICTAEMNGQSTATRVGANAYLRKPIFPSALLEMTLRYSRHLAEVAA